MKGKELMAAVDANDFWKKDLRFTSWFWFSKDRTESSSSKDLGWLLSFTMIFFLWREICGWNAVAMEQAQRKDKATFMMVFSNSNCLHGVPTNCVL